MSSLVQRGAGGVAGLGGTVAARSFLDEPGQTRLFQPSVLYGLGTGAIASGLWFTDIETPVVGEDFWASHALSALPAALFFAAFPKQQGTTTTQQVQSAFDSLLQSPGRRSSGGSNGDSNGGSDGSTQAVAGRARVQGHAGRRRRTGT